MSARKRLLQQLRLYPVALYCCGWYLAAVSLAHTLAGLFILLLLILCGRLLPALLLGFLVGGVDLSLQALRDYRIVGDEEFSSLVHVRAEPRRPRSGRIVLDLVLLQRDMKEIRCQAKDLPWRNASRLRRGDIASARIRVRKDKFFPCEVMFVTPAISTQTQLFSPFRDRVTAWIQQAELPFGGIYEAMMLGQRDVISRRIQGVFRGSGLLHILVLSGFHLSLVVFALFIFLKPVASRILSARRLVRVDRILASSTALGAFLFVSASFGGNSLSRAFLILLAGVLLRVIGARGSFVHSLSLGTFAFLSIWPTESTQASAILSLSAYCAIAVLLRLEQPLLFGFSLAAVMASVSAILFGWFCTWGLLLAPAMSTFFAFLGTVGGWLAFLVSPLWEDLSLWLLRALAYPIMEFARLGSRQPWLVVCASTDSSLGKVSLLLAFLLVLLILRAAIRHYRVSLGLDR